MPRNFAPALPTSSISHGRLPQQLDREGALPPLHEARSMASTSASRRGVSTHSESFYDRRDAKANNPLGLASSISQHAGRLSQADDSRSTFADMENLKRQVARLTQLKRDRDSYIQDLLADAEIAEKRHEVELFRRVARGQREVLERLTAQEHEHTQFLEERSRAHATAVAQLIAKHEQQLLELRSASKVEAGVELAQDRHTGTDASVLERLLRGLKFLDKALTSHIMRLDHKEPPEPEAESDEPEAEEESQRDLATAALQALEGATKAVTRMTSDRNPCADVKPVHALVNSTTSSLQFSLLDGIGSRLLRSHKEFRRLAVIRAWSSLVAIERCTTLYMQDAKAAAADAARQLAEARRAQVSLLVHTDFQRLSQVAIRVWRASVHALRVEATSRRELGKAEAAAAAEYTALQEDSRQHVAELANRLRDRAHRDVFALTQKLAAKVYFRWYMITRERQAESAHRYQILSAAADASAEAYRLRNESRKVATELRRQRRAHGVAAIHASLDRRLQAIVHSWSAVSKEAQHESMYQRQLDMAAAESAASCAVLRMEWRRSAIELREQRQASGLRSIAASAKHVNEIVFYAWRVILSEAQQEVHSHLKLGAANAEAAAARAEVRRKAAEVSKWQFTHISTVRCAQSTYWLRVAFACWWRESEAGRQSKESKRHSENLRGSTFRVAEAFVAKDVDSGQRQLAFGGWRLWATARRDKARREQSLQEGWADEQAATVREVEALRVALDAAESSHRDAMHRQEQGAEERLLDDVQRERRRGEEALALCEARAEERAAAEARQRTSKFEELEANFQASLCEQAAKHAMMVRQHADAFKEILENTEARHAEALRAESTQLASLHRAEEASARNLAAIQAQELQAEAALHAQASAFEVRLTEVEARHSAELRAQAAALCELQRDSLVSGH